MANNFVSAASWFLVSFALQCNPRNKTNQISMASKWCRNSKQHPFEPFLNRHKIIFFPVHITWYTGHRFWKLFLSCQQWLWLRFSMVGVGSERFDWIFFFWILIKSFKPNTWCYAIWPKCGAQFDRIEICCQSRLYYVFLLFFGWSLSVFVQNVQSVCLRLFSIIPSCFNSASLSQWYPKNHFPFNSLI